MPSNCPKWTLNTAVQAVRTEHYVLCDLGHNLTAGDRRALSQAVAAGAIRSPRAGTWEPLFVPTGAR
jgi:hypothetical protein